MFAMSWDVLFPNLGWILVLIAIGLAFWNARGRIDDIEARLKSIEENPILLASKNLTVKFWSDLLYDVFERRRISGENPLTQEEVNRRMELTTKLEQRTIIPSELMELQGILNKELEEAKATNDLLAILALLFLLGLVIALLSRR